MRNSPFWLARAVCVAATSLLATGCLNIYSPVDAPAGDAQLLSAARACFDRGDYACAQSNYQKLSTSYSDISANEQAMATLDQNGVGMSAFLTFVGNGAGGKGLTAMAESIAPGNTTKRASIYSAFLQSSPKLSPSISSNTQLQKLTQFMASIALAAELLSEAQGSSSQLLKSHIVAAPASCTSTSLPCTGCNSSSALPAATSQSDIASNAPTATTPNADMVYWAVRYAYEGANALSPSGSFGSMNSGFSAIFSAGQPSNGSPFNECFRAQLINFGIGR